MKEDKGIDAIIFDMYVLYAKRAMLGGMKGIYMMEELKAASPELWTKVMEEAKKQLERDFEKIG